MTAWRERGTATVRACRLAVLAAWAALALPCLPAQAQDPGLYVVGHVGGQRGAIAADGRVLARAAGAAVEFHAAGAQARPLGTVLLDAMVHDLVLAGTRAYAATGAGLAVLDMADPAHPRQAAAVPLDEAMLVAVSGPAAYVVTRDGTLAVLDVSDPLYPRLRDGKGASQEGRPRLFDRPLAMRAAGGRLYVLDAGYGMRQYDLSNPFDPAERDRTAVEQPLDPGAPALLAVEGERAVVRDGDRLRLLDFTNPLAPRSEDLIGPNREVARAAALRGKRLAVAGMEELWVMDLSQPGRSRVFGMTEMTWPATSLALSPDGARAFVGMQDGSLMAVSLADPRHPRPTDVRPGLAEVDELATGAGLKEAKLLALHIRPRVLHQLALDKDGVQAISSDLVGREAQSISVLGGRVYAPVNVGMLSFLPGTGYQARRYDIGRTEGAAFALGGYVAAMSGSRYWLIDPVDIKVVTQPVPMPGGSAVLAHAVAASRLYVSGPDPDDDTTTSLRVLSVDRPDAPRLLATVPLPGPATGIAAGRNVLVGVRGRTSGLLVIGGTSSDGPGIVGAVIAPAGLHGLAVNGRCAYAFDDEGEVMAFDVSDPQAPRLTATLRLPGAAADTAAIVPLGGLLYAPRGPGGVYVLRDTACTP